MKKIISNYFLIKILLNLKDDEEFTFYYKEIHPDCSQMIKHRKANCIKTSCDKIENNDYRFFDKESNYFRHCKVENIFYLKENEDEYFIVNI